MNPNQSNSPSKRVLLIFIIIAVAIAGIVGAILDNRNSQKSGGEYVAPDSPAFLVYEDKAYLPLKNNASNNMLRADVAYFARQSYPAYNPDKQPSVSFLVTKKPATDGDTLKLVGHFEKVKNEIAISVRTLKNDRIETSITDNKTKKEINAQLPSNSIRNKYIASLPISTATYSIDYTSTTDNFTLTIFDGSAAATKEAEDALKAGIKIDDLSKEKYEFFVPNSAR